MRYRSADLMTTRSGYEFIQFVAISSILVLSCISNNSTSSAIVTPKTASVFGGSDNLKRDTNDCHKHSVYRLKMFRCCANCFITFIV
jgi:hypothetical protein